MTVAANGTVTATRGDVTAAGTINLSAIKSVTTPDGASITVTGQAKLVVEPVTSGAALNAGVAVRAVAIGGETYYLPAVAGEPGAFVIKNASDIFVGGNTASGAVKDGFELFTKESLLDITSAVSFIWNLDTAGTSTTVYGMTLGSSVDRADTLSLAGVNAENVTNAVVTLSTSDYAKTFLEKSFINITLNIGAKSITLVDVIATDVEIAISQGSTTTIGEALADKYNHVLTGTDLNQVLDLLQSGGNLGLETDIDDLITLNGDDVDLVSVSSGPNLVYGDLDLSSLKTENGTATKLDLSSSIISGKGLTLTVAALSGGTSGSKTDLGNGAPTGTTFDTNKAAGVEGTGPKSDQTVKLPSLDKILGDISINNMTIASTNGYQHAPVVNDVVDLTSWGLESADELAGLVKSITISQGENLSSTLPYVNFVLEIENGDNDFTLALNNLVSKNVYNTMLKALATVETTDGLTSTLGLVDWLASQESSNSLVSDLANSAFDGKTFDASTVSFTNTQEADGEAVVALVGLMVNEGTFAGVLAP